jgi:rubrerythrin
MWRPNSAPLQLSCVLLLVCITARAAYAQEQQTVARLAGKLDDELAAIQSKGSSTKKQELSASLRQQLMALKGQSIMVFGSRRQQLADKMQQLAQSCEKWQSASSDDAARAAAERARRLWPEIKSLYPREALEILPPLWSCPMHQELMKTAAGNCPICFISFQPLARARVRARKR